MGEFEDLTLGIFQKVSNGILRKEFAGVINWAPGLVPGRDEACSGLTLRYDNSKVVTENFGCLLKILRLEGKLGQFGLSGIEVLSKILSETVYPQLHQIFSSDIFHGESNGGPADPAIMNMIKNSYFKAFGLLSLLTDEIFKIISHICFNYTGEDLPRLEKFYKSITNDLQIQKEFFGGKFLKFVSGFIQKGAFGGS